MYGYEIETKEIKKTKDKIEPQQIHHSYYSSNVPLYFPKLIYRFSQG